MRDPLSPLRDDVSVSGQVRSTLQTARALPPPLSNARVVAIRQRVEASVAHSAAPAWRLPAFALAACSVAVAFWTFREWEQPNLTTAREVLQGVPVAERTRGTPGADGPAPESPASRGPAAAAPSARAGVGTPRAGTPHPAVSASGAPATPNVGEPLGSASAASPSGATQPNALALESQALARALTALRRERDPVRSLALLDAYDAEFPSGALRQEAALARLDALSAAGRDDELKAQLERLPVGVLPRSQDFRLRRAELRASHGECQGALADANAVLTQAQGAVRARAEAVIARCSSAP